MPILPREIERIIIQLTGLNDPSTMVRRRRELRSLADDFFQNQATKNQYLPSYLAYHFPTNLMKTYAVTKEIDAAFPDLMAGRRRFRVLDLGCGSGAAMFGFFFSHNQTAGSVQFDLQGFDSSSPALNQCRVIAGQLQAVYPNLNVHVNRRALDPSGAYGINGTYDAILCVNFLVESSAPSFSDSRVISQWLHRLNPNGLLLIIEPALKSTSRRLMSLRTELSKIAGVQIIRPCLHTSPCPLLAIETREEWCHETIPWQPPDFMIQLNQGLRREIDRLKFSYLVLARIDRTTPDKSEFRVISRRLKEKGKVKCFLCTPEGYVELYRLDKDRDEANAAFDSIQQGDIIALDGFETRGRLFKVHRNTRLMIRHAGCR